MKKKRLKVKRLHIDNRIETGTDWAFDNVARALLQGLLFEGYDQVVITVDSGDGEIDAHTIWAPDTETVKLYEDK